MWKDTPITRLFGVRLPIIQGPMGNGFSTPQLVANVSNAGGLGSYGGYGMSPDELRSLIGAIRALTSEPFSINLWVPRVDEQCEPPDEAAWTRALLPTHEVRDELGLPAPARPSAAPRLFEAQVEAILELAPPVFSFIFGVPAPELLAACRARGIRTIGTATNVAEARELESAGVDAICASGSEAGGHRGLFRGQLSDALMGTMALVPQIRDAVRLPVIAAGGIADGRGIAAALALGADAVQIGTAFLAADESGTNEQHRAVLGSEAAQHTVITRAFSGRHGRAIKNRLVLEIERDERAILPFPYQASIAYPVRTAAAQAGRVELQQLWAGQAAPLARRAPAERVLQRLVDETEQVLARLRAS
jgi:nitronate monooxygenase